jgi:hypothetical protein
MVPLNESRSIWVVTAAIAVKSLGDSRLMKAHTIPRKFPTSPVLGIQSNGELEESCRRADSWEATPRGATVVEAAGTTSV